MNRLTTTDIELLKNHGITQAQFDIMDDALINDENSSDDELEKLFKENDISAEIIRSAIKLRSQFMINPLLELCINKEGLITGNIRDRLNKQVQ